MLLFLFVPGDPDSGAVYVLDRKNGTWYDIDFEDEQFGGYSVNQLETLLTDCKFLDLIERPRLWRTGLPWAVAPGTAPGRRAITIHCVCEIGAVCTLPEFRGRGYARALVAFLAARILAAGKTPFLHVKSENGAKVVYQKIGFRLRATIWLTLISLR